MVDKPATQNLGREINLHLTEEDCLNIGELFQVAIRAAGIPAARAAMPIVDKIDTALKGAIVPATGVPAGSLLTPR